MDNRWLSELLNDAAFPATSVGAGGESYQESPTSIAKTTG